MKFVTYRAADGTVRHGRLDGDTVIDRGEGDLLRTVQGNTDADGATVPLAEVTLLAPLLSPPKVLCAATNYQEHIVEGGGTPYDKSRVSPKMFIKPHTSIIGPGEPFAIPEISSAADWEAELCVVIGKEARGVSADEALDYVYGYMASNDISLRSLAVGYERDMTPWASFFDWLEGKWADGAAPIGPYLVTADEIPDPQDLPISLTLNGTVRQQATTADMIFSVAELVAFTSRLCTLVPGDIILTGTPSGVGATTSEFLTEGDELVVDLGPLGRLVTPITGVSSPVDPAATPA